MRRRPAGALYHTTMLRWLLVQNRQGKSRLSKFYVPLDDEEKVRLKGEVHRLIAPRDQKYQSNFVEVGHHWGRGVFAERRPLTTAAPLSSTVSQLQGRVPQICRPLLLRVH